MTAKKIALVLAALSVAVAPVAANAGTAKPGGYIGFTTNGVKHWIPNPAVHNKAWVAKWLEKERKHGREYDFDSRG